MTIINTDQPNVHKWIGGFPKTEKYIRNFLETMSGCADLDEVLKYINNQDKQQPVIIRTLENTIFSIDLSVSSTIIQSLVPQLTKTLKFLGIENFDLVKGTYIDKYQRSVKLSKLFTDYSQARQDLEIVKTGKLQILFTSDPWMKLSMTTGRKWKSCFRLTYTEDRCKEILVNHNYMIGYIYPGEATDFDQRELAIGRFITALAYKRHTLKYNKILKHSDLIYCQQRFSAIVHNDVLKALNVIANQHSKKISFCPLCGDHIYTEIKIDPKHQYNTIIPSRLYTTLPNLKTQWNEVLLQLAEKINTVLGPNSVGMKANINNYYANEEVLGPYPEGILIGRLRHI